MQQTSCLLPGEALFGAHMITAIVMDQAKSEGGAMPCRESEEPIVCARQRVNQVGGSPTRPVTPGRYPKVGVTAHWPGSADREETERTQLWKRRDNGAGDS